MFTLLSPFILKQWVRRYSYLLRVTPFHRVLKISYIKKPQNKKLQEASSVKYNIFMNYTTHFLCNTNQICVFRKMKYLFHRDYHTSQ